MKKYVHASCNGQIAASQQRHTEKKWDEINNIEENIKINIWLTLYIYSMVLYMNNSIMSFNNTYSVLSCTP